MGATNKYQRNDKAISNISFGTKEHHITMYGNLINRTGQGLLAGLCYIALAEVVKGSSFTPEETLSIVRNSGGAMIAFGILENLRESYKMYKDDVNETIDNDFDNDLENI